MFKKLFGSKEATPAVKPQTPTAVNKTIDSIQSLQEHEDSLEKRKALLEKKIEAELQKARELNKAGKKPAALACLKKKKLFEQEVANLDNMIMRVTEQRIMLEGQRSTVEVVSTMHKAALTAKENMKAMNVDKVDDVLADITEVSEQMAQINDVFANPIGAGAALDEDELLGELEELDATQLDEELLEPAPVPTTRVPAASASSSLGLPSAPTSQKARPTAGKSPEELELEALQAEMAL